MTIHYFFKYFLAIFLAVTIVSVKAQYIAVDTQTYTTEQLVKDVFFGNQNSNCIAVENVSISGWDFGNGNRSYGYFQSNGSGFEMEKGIILSTGGALNAVGPNLGIQSLLSGSWSGDRDLEDAISVQGTFNATILEFDFISNNTNKISFEYLFASEQYLRQQDTGSCDYTDGFAFLIKEAGTSNPYRNLAVIPGTTVPIKSNNVRGGGEKCPAVNEEYFGHYNADESPTNFNGQTKILTANTDVIPGVKYHLKLVIADQGNGRYDSGVFLKAGSFLGTKDLGPDRSFTAGTALCVGSTLVLDATTANSTYQWYQDGIIIAGATNPLFTVDKTGVYEVMIDQLGCKLKGSINIDYVEKPIVLEKSFCNYNNGNSITVNLGEISNQLISNYKSYFNVQYYLKEADAIAGNSNTINTLAYLDDVTIYIRAGSGSCTPQIKEVRFNSPKKSATLQDKIICGNTTTSLTTETTYTYYKWRKENGEIISEGSAINSINNIPVGKYSVELTSLNSCFLVQDVNVFSAALPQITNIDVSGSTATISVIGGTTPYEYSLDNLTFQSSNIFTNVQRGLNTVYVKDAQNCGVIMKEFLVVNLINVLTPNSDGKNEVLDYSDLNIKKEVKIEIYDRYGNQVFLSQKQPYVWDGKMNGRILPTGSYWYILNWIEPDTNLPVSYKGWVLLKNRE